MLYMILLITRCTEKSKIIETERTVVAGWGLVGGDWELEVSGYMVSVLQHEKTLVIDGCSTE